MADYQRTSLDRNLRWNNINGIFQTLSQNMLMPFTGIFAIKLGATDAQIAALSSWPALVSLFSMIPGARMVDRYPRKQKLVATFMLFDRFFFLLLALLPFAVRDEARRPLVFVAMIALMNIPGAVANVSWQSFMGTVIPEDRRAKAFATRNQLMGLCGVVASLIAGRTMSELLFPVGFQAMFFVGFILAMFEIAAFFRLEEKPSKPKQAIRQTGSLPERLKKTLQGARNYPGYWRFAGASLIFHFGWQMGWPLFTKFQVQELGATPAWISIISVCTTIGSIMAYPIWARLSERYSNKSMLVFAAVGMALTPFFYAISTQLWMLAVLNMVIGVSIAGALLLLFNTLLEVSPEQDRTQYIAYHNTATSMTAVIAPYVGVAIVAAAGIRWALVSSAIARGIGALAFAVVYLLERQRKDTSSEARATGVAS